MSLYLLLLTVPVLVYLREHQQISNSEYRRLNRVDTMVAGQELRGLVEAGLIEQQG
jgi:hypothetical protein